MDRGGHAPSRYRRLRELGSGAAGRVWLVEDRLRDGARLALKELTEARSRRFARLREEFATLSELRHPNLVEVFDLGAGRDEAPPYFTMEHVEGVDFVAAAREEGPETFLRLAAEALRTLSFLHDFGFVHRDLKPGNMMVRRQPRLGSRLVVLDFGLSLRDEESDPAESTPAGTLYYMAPEVLGGRKPRPRCDLYSLGAVFHEAVHGSVPVELVGNNLARFLDDVRHGRRARPEIPAGFPAAVGPWIDELLQPDPADRPPTAAEALARLGVAAGIDLPRETPHTRAARLASGPPPGRDAEVEALWSALNEGNGPRIVWIAGGPGMGKQRALRWLSGSAVGRGWDLLHVPDGAAPPDLSMLEPSAGRRGLLVTLRRAEAAGERTVQFLARFLRHGDFERVRLLVTIDPAAVRDPELKRLLGRSGTSPGLARVDLPALDREGVRRMMLRASGAQAVSAAGVERLHDWSGGNPAMAEAFLAEGSWERAEGAVAGQALEEALESRLTGLPPAAIAWLEALAVWEVEAPEELVNAIAGCDSERGAAAGAELFAAGLAQRGPEGWSIGSGLLRRQVVRRMPAADRRRRFARALDRARDRETAPLQLARLAAGAEDAEAAIGYAVVAADEAVARSDATLAAGACAFALRLLPRRDPRRRELRWRQAQQLREANRPADAARAYGAAWRLATDPAERIEGKAWMAMMLVQSGRFAVGRRMASRILELPEPGRPAVAGARAAKALGIAVARMGQFGQSRHWLQRALEEFTAAGDEAERAHTLQALGIAETNEGLLEARERFREAIDLYRRLGKPERALMSGCGLGLIEQRASRYAESLRIYEETRAVAREFGNQLVETIVTHYLSRNELQQDRLDRALAYADEAYDLARLLDDKRLQASCKGYSALALLRAGRGAEALRTVEQVLAAGLEHVDQNIIAEMHLVHAETLMGRDGADAAQVAAALETALPAAREIGDPDGLIWALTVEMQRCAVFEPERMAAVRREFEEYTARGGYWVQPYYEARFDLAHAEGLLRRGETGATRLAARAVTEAARAGLPALVAQGEALVARIHRERGRPNEAAQAAERGRQALAGAAERIEDKSLRERFVEAPAFRELMRRETPLQAADRRLIALYDMIRVLNSETDPDQLLEKILDLAIDVVGAERGMILLRDPKTESFSVSLARNLEKETEEDVRTFSRQIVETAGSGQAILSLDALHDERFADLRSVSLFRIRSLICVPLRSRGDVVGTVYVDARRAGQLFGEEDLKFLEAFADHAALALENARSRRKLEEENERLQAAVEQRTSFGNLVGSCPAMQQVFDLIEKVADSSLSVLILGETGTGKELVAKAIHFHSGRRRAAFVSENCAALPESLLQSELFGHVKGAFTGADRDRQGMFELADGGTLFLDEVGDMSPGMQAQLLRALQEGEVRRVGGDRPIRVDVRTLLATHRRLEDLVEAGSFREDLLYRVQQFVIELPALRERPGDVPLLAHHFLERIAGESGRPAPRITRRAVARLEEYEWPGNVRQLENTIRRLAVLAGDGAITEDLVDLDPAIARSRPSSQRAAAPATSMDLSESDERDRIRAALERAGNNRTKAARLLGISRATIYRKIKEYGL